VTRSLNELPTDASVVSDPIFCAMQRYLQAEARVDAIPDQEEDELLPPVLAESTRARRALAETVPLTLAGLAAFARFLEHQSRVVLDSAFFIDDREHLAFYATLAHSLEMIMRAAAVASASVDGDRQHARGVVGA
jgi:hypothetical protein